MTRRKQKFPIALISLLAACLLAVALVWLLNRQANDAGNETATEGGALTEDQQSPVVVPETPEITEPPEEADAPNSPASTEKTIRVVAIPSHFATMDDARDFFARLVAEEFDLLEADESIVFPEMSEEAAKRRAEFRKRVMESFDNNPEARLWDDNNPDAPRIRELAAMALENVYDRVATGFEDEYAGLWKALLPLFDSGFDGMSLLVRAGRLPEEVLYSKVKLPNGDIFNMLPNRKLVINYQVKGKLTKRGHRKLLENEQKELDLLSRLAGGNLSESEASKLNGELTRVQQELERLRKPVYIDKSSGHMRGDSDHIDFKTIELNLGVLDTGAKSSHPPGVSIPDDLLPAEE